MVCNSLAAVSVALELGASPEDISKSLADFPGVARRTEILGRPSGVLVIDDYAHHPSEISATLKSLRDSFLAEHAKETKSDLGKIVLLFEPHRYSRTSELLEEFACAFEDADSVYVSDIYAAGEKPIDGIDSKRLVDAIEHQEVRHVPRLKDALPEIMARLKPGDILATFGAGAIGGLAKDVVERLR